MTEEKPMVIFLHYWGSGSAEKLAGAFKATFDELGKAGVTGGLLGLGGLLKDGKGGDDLLVVDQF